MAIKNKMIRNTRSGQDIIFIQTAKDTNGKLLEMEASWRPGSVPPPMHYHPYQLEEFMVLEGELSVKMDGKVKVYFPGDIFSIPPCKAHSIWNNSHQKTVINWKVKPAMTTEYFLETGIGLANDGKVDGNGMPNLLQVALLANRYSNVFRMSSPPYFIQRIVFYILSPFAWMKGYKSVYRKYID